MTSAATASLMMQCFRLNVSLPEEENRAFYKAFKQSEKNRKSLNENLGLALDWGRHTSHKTKIVALYLLYQEDGKELPVREFARKIVGDEKTVGDLEKHKRRFYAKNQSENRVPDDRDGLLHHILESNRGKIPSEAQIRKLLRKDKNGYFPNLEIATNHGQGEDMKLATILKTSATTPTIDLVADRAALKATSHDTKIDELRALLREVKAKILEAEAAGGGETISPDQYKIHQRVLTFLGEKPSADAPRNWEGLLQSLRLDRDAIERAMEILEEKRAVLRATRFAEERQSREQEWRDLIKIKALKLVEVIKLEKRCQEFKKLLAGPGGEPNLPCGASLARTLFGTGEIKAFLEECVRNEFILEKEANL